MRLPLVTYWAQISASAPQATHRVHSVASCAWPSASFQRALVATLNVVRAVPRSMSFVSGSCPRWPLRGTRVNTYGSMVHPTSTLHVLPTLHGLGEGL